MLNARLIRRVSPLLLTAITVGALAGCGWSNQYKSLKTMTQTTTHMDGSYLDLNTHNGTIEIIGSPDATEVEITATIKCCGETQDEADQRVADADIEIIRSTDGTLTIRPIFPVERRNNDGANFVVTIPNANGATLDTSNGRILVSNLSGKLIADSSNGRIEVTNHDGDVFADTSNGRVIATNVTGNVTADTSNGKVIFKNIDGDMVADTSNGSVSITLAAGQTGSINVDTSNGSINIGIGDGYAGHFVMSTSNGGITVSDPKGRCSSKNIGKRNGNMTIGTPGGGPNQLSTSNGSITITVD